jgi:hypothetical protein
MAVLDQVRGLKQQGMNDSQIATALQESGISPREINDAMAQANIKDAVSNPMDQNQYNSDPNHEVRQGEIQGMQPSMMNYQTQQPGQNPNNIDQLPQDGPYAQEYNNAPSPQGDVPQPGQSYQDYPEESYGGYANEFQGGGGGYGNYSQQPYDDYASQDTMSEIASQMVTEKTKSLSKKMADLGEIGSLLTAKVEKMDERLSRVESIIDQLQTSLMRKATAQEQNIGDIKTEMEAMQESFGKVINPLLSKARTTKTKHKTTKRKTRKKKK